jgi:hypothetical protein
MYLNNIIFALATATAATTALAGTPYVAPAPEPAPVAGSWFIGGSFGQFSPDGSSSYDGSDLTLGDISGISLAAGANWAGQGGVFPAGATLGGYFAGRYGPGWQGLNVANVLPGEGVTDSALRTRVSDVNLDMYSLHFGRSLASVGGFDLAAYLEVAWITGDMDVEGIATNLTGGPNGPNFGNQILVFSGDLDVDIVPVTLNFKAERNIYGPIGAYCSGGIGYAWTHVSGLGMSESDGGFYAQAAAGLVWNVTSSFDIYGGGRWIYLDSLDFGDTGIELDNQLGWEVGLRYKF